MLRLPIPEYAKEAYREAINNALIHRDYSKLGTVFVQWHSDHLLITNPGSFPSGITPQNLLTHEPKPRNPRLAEICQRIGLAESSARGVDRIYLGQLRYGRPSPDYSRSDEEAVRLVLRGGTANLEFVHLVHDLDQSGQGLSLDELIALNQLQIERRVDVQALSQLIQKGETDARKTLEHLVERGLVESSGQRNRSYFLSAKVYAKLGTPAGYVRLKGIDPIQQEAMVVEFIKAHGPITKAQTAELCQISSENARVLLRKMTNDGKIALVGSKRGSAYVLMIKEPLTPITDKELISVITGILKDKESLSLDEIDAALHERGFEVAGNNKRNYLTGMMSRRKTLFERIDRGRYRLIR
ncbi:MAG TPA: transcriptional regulator [Cyanobacteria bacterium UBA8530]|nr:transcriptional regulator [Cyanobacteria bacterium UBA8530]